MAQCARHRRRRSRSSSAATRRSSSSTTPISTPPSQGAIAQQVPQRRPDLRVREPRARPGGVHERSPTESPSAVARAQGRPGHGRRRRDRPADRRRARSRRSSSHVGDAVERGARVVARRRAGTRSAARSTSRPSSSASAPRWRVAARRPSARSRRSSRFADRGRRDPARERHAVRARGVLLQRATSAAIWRVAEALEYGIVGVNTGLSRRRWRRSAA